jgi:hypothetical protein
VKATRTAKPAAAKSSAKRTAKSAPAKRARKG